MKERERGKEGEKEREKMRKRFGINFLRNYGNV